jgi:hypothetical protein
MKRPRGLFSPVVVFVSVFALSQASVAVAADDESQDKAAPAGETPTVPVVEEGGTPLSPAAGETPPPSTAPAPAPPTRQGLTQPSQAVDRAANTSARPSAVPSAVPHAREEKARPYEPVEKPSDADAGAGADTSDAHAGAGADTSEQGHLGLVLNLMKDSKGGGGYELGFRVGWRPLPSAEIGVLVAAWGSGWTVDAIPILLQFNGIVPVTPILSFFGGGQLGLLHYRLDTSGMGYDDGMVGLDAFAYGLQAGVGVRVTSNFSIRLELAWLHANEASTTLSHSFSTDTFGMEASIFFHANIAFCLTF